MWDTQTERVTIYIRTYNFRFSKRLSDLTNREIDAILQ